MLHSTVLDIKPSDPSLPTNRDALRANDRDCMTEATHTDHDEPGTPAAPVEHVSLSDPEFKTQLAQVIPHLRAFGRSLSGSRDLADDLVQETLLKAWAARKRFQAGTNMRAWTFIILRNLFLSQMRRARFRGEWDEHTANRMLAAPASQDRHIELADMQRALLHLPQPQREALILVGAGGFAYEEAAEICGCAVGTIKSRVNRARTRLAEMLKISGDADFGPDPHSLAVTSRTFART